jgi:serine O-acetyltransferase
VGIPGKNVKEERKCAIDLDHGELPDPIAEVIKLILERQDELENQIKALGISTTNIGVNELLEKKSEIEKIFSEGSGI